MKLLIALLPAVTWAATITSYEVNVQAAQPSSGFASPAFSAWSINFAGPGSGPAPDSMPYADASFIWSGLHLSDHDRIIIVRFDSPTIGPFYFHSRQPGTITEPGTYHAYGMWWGVFQEYGVSADITAIENPEPATFALIGSALLSGLLLSRKRMARLRSAA